MLEIIKWVAVIAGFPFLLVSVFAYTLLLTRLALRTVDEIEEKWDYYWIEKEAKQEKLKRQKEFIKTLTSRKT